MALIRSLNTAVAGLKSQQFRIESIGDNIANVDTTAFKGQRVDFSTLLSQTITFGVAPQGFLGGIDPIQIGHGNQVASTTTNFNQGPTEATGVNTDLAIQGNGFFVMTDQAGATTYTRDGSFTVNPSNLLHDPANGFLVQGYAADENFQVTPGGPLTSIEIPVGTMTIADATTRVNLDGNLDADSAVATQGTRLLSDIFYDNRTANTDLISSSNPVGLARATADTPLQNLVLSLGDFTSATGTTAGTAAQTVMLFPELENQLTGVEINIASLKGERALPDALFTVGDPPPTGGTNLGDLVNFLQNNLGINSGVFDGVQQTENMISYQRESFTGEAVNGVISVGVAGVSDDVTSLTSLTDMQADYQTVQVGDLIRFESGESAGQIAEIVAVSSSGLTGNLDTLTLRSDGFNSLTVVPSANDTYTIHAPAGVRLADPTPRVVVDPTLPSVSVTTPTTLAGSAVSSFTVSDTSVTDWGLERGISEQQVVEYQSGGTTVTGLVTNVTGDTFTISYADSQAQPPDAGTSFTVSSAPTGTIEIAGNVGSVNHIDNLEVTSGGARISMFDNPPVIEAQGGSTTQTITVYDSLGTPRQVNLTMVYEASSGNGPNTWRYFAESVNDADGDRVVGSGTVVFGSNGQFLTSGEPAEMVSINLAPDADAPAGAVSPFTFQLDFSRVTSFSTDISEVTMVDQDGFESGTLREFSIGTDGTITGVFSNGLTRTLGQVAMASFANPNGLFSEGGNYFTSAPNSGTPQVGVPGTFGRGTILSGFLEESNVDLAQQFTELIIGQRAYQANARTITVSDEMLQELVNLI